MRIVITSWGSYGDVNPYLGLAHALRARGHVPVLAMPAYYRGVVEREGFQFAPIEPNADPALAPDLVRKVMDSWRGAEVIYREILIPALAESFAALQALVTDADLLVSHPATLAAPIVAAETGIPWVSTVLSPLHFLSAHDPVIPPLAPWLRHAPYALLHRMAPFFARLGRAVSAPWVREVQVFRHARGLSAGAHPVFDAHAAPQGVLAFFSRVFGGPYPDWPSQVTITGQLRHDRAHGAQLDPTLADFLDAGPAPIVFTLGSSAVQLESPFYEESLRAVQRMGRRAVLLAGAQRVDALSTFAGSELFIAAEAPHSLLFPRASAIVHQCGMGTLGTALHAGVPMLAVPWANDQPDNAWRLTRLGVARTLYPRQYRARRVAQELTTLLETSVYRETAQRIAPIVRAERGAEHAVDIIDRVLGV